MADVTDVGNALVKAISSAVYPAGITSPSVGNCATLIYQGWPDPQQLTAALQAGGAHVSVFPRPGDKVDALALGDIGWSEQSNDGTAGTLSREVRRQSRTFQVTVWAGCFALRDTVAQAVDSDLAVITRLVLPDGSTAQISYANSTQDDNSQKQGIYRRDLFYTISYALTQTVNGYSIQQAAVSFRISQLPL